ncbi:MAG: hypothetical protein LRY55_06470, partial [Leadbetterella sp.]|nr:hypothetical protein [Leadbetterella sp.]
TGYMMGDIGLFHLSHYGNKVSWIEQSDPAFPVYARFHEFLLKPRVNGGAKIQAGDLRFDLFIGLGYRVGVRKHQVIDASDFRAGRESSILVLFNPAEKIVLDRPSGWTSVKAVPFLSLGLRLGLGFKPVTSPLP